MLRGGEHDGTLSLSAARFRLTNYHKIIRVGRLCFVSIQSHIVQEAVVPEITSLLLTHLSSLRMV